MNELVQPDRSDPAVAALRLVLQGLLKQLVFDGVLSVEKLRELKCFTLEVVANLPKPSADEDQSAGVQLGGEIRAFFDSIE
jgi:hypothetical protein